MSLLSYRACNVRLVPLSTASVVLVHPLTGEVVVLPGRAQVALQRHWQGLLGLKAE